MPRSAPRSRTAVRRSLPTLRAAAALTAACGAPSTTAEPAAPAADGAFPVTVEHAYGTTEIPISVSDELMGELSRELLVWNVGFAPEERAAVENNPIYPTLSAVREGRVLWIEDPVVPGAFSWGTVLSLDYALRQLVPQIAETVG